MYSTFAGRIHHITYGANKEKSGEKHVLVRVLRPRVDDLEQRRLQHVLVDALDLVRGQREGGIRDGHVPGDFKPALELDVIIRLGSQPKHVMFST